MSMSISYTNTRVLALIAQLFHSTRLVLRVLHLYERPLHESTLVVTLNSS